MAKKMGGHGGNLKLKAPSQSPHVSAKKDKMAGNIGNHMGRSDQFGPGGKVTLSSGMGKPKTGKDRY